MDKLPMNPMQAMVDGMSARWQKDRAARQMTLGKLIGALEALDGDRAVRGIGYAHSYRGYYSDLSFDSIEGERTVADLLAECRCAMGRTFQGWKGGDFLMGEHTPLWISEEGTCSGRMLMGLNVEVDPIEPVTEEEEW